MPPGISHASYKFWLEAVLPDKVKASFPFILPVDFVLQFCGAHVSIQNVMNPCTQPHTRIYMMFHTFSYLTYPTASNMNKPKCLGRVCAILVSRPAGFYQPPWHPSRFMTITPVWTRNHSQQVFSSHSGFMLCLFLCVALTGHRRELLSCLICLQISQMRHAFVEWKQYASTLLVISLMYSCQFVLLCS